MISRFEPHLHTLPEAQQALWPGLKPALGLGFVLYGGTAIALRLGHRISVDFDFFREAPLDHVELRTALPFLNGATTIQERPDVLSVLVPVGEQYVKLSFFGPIRFGRVGVPQLTADGVMQVASLQDLMATKLKVILQRVEAKDYRDVAALLKASESLEKGLAAARTLFHPTFQPGESLKALVYFEGGDLQVLTECERACLIQAASQVRGLPAANIISHHLQA